MVPSKSQLRECARVALAKRSYLIEPITGAGIVPGAQLRATKNREILTIAVRTTINRKVGLMRATDGEWRTIPTVDEVVVVALAVDKPGYAEVLGFDPKEIIKRFDAELAAQIKRMPKLKKKAPVFMQLDDRRRKNSPDKDLGLKSKALWSLFVPIGPAPITNPRDANAGFIERVKREFAELNGVDVARVRVSFSIDA